jgi:hypothetical protein
METIIDSFIRLLQSLLDQPCDLPAGIPRLQQQIWNATPHAKSSPQWEVLEELAYDLDYYQPDPRIRSENKSFYGDERALAEIKSTLLKLQSEKPSEE